MPVTTAVIAGGLGLAKTVGGLIGGAAAKKQAAELEKTRPKAQISQQTRNELTLNESELSNGLGAKATRAYTEQEDKGLSTSLSAMLKGGGNVNSVGELYGADESGRQRMVQLQESTRLNQIQKLMDSQRNMAGEEQKMFEFNEWMPYADKVKANAAAKESANAQVSSGISSMASAGMQYGQNKAELDMFNDYLNPKSNMPSTTNSTGFMPDAPLGSGDFKQPSYNPLPH